MKNRIAFFNLGLIAVMTSACSGGPKADTFKDVLNAHYADKPSCVVSKSKFDKNGVSPAYAPPKEGQITILDRFAEVGLVTRVQSTRDAKDFLTGRSVKQDIITYTVTPLGRESLDPISFKGSIIKLCYGNRTVTEITNFTDPAESNGVIGTRVNYKYTIKNAPEWAKSEIMQDGFSVMKADLTAGGAEGAQNLVKTNSGWVHPSDID